MYSASSTSGRSGSKQSRTVASAANTFSVDGDFGTESGPAGGIERVSHPLATGDGHR